MTVSFTPRTLAGTLSPRASHGHHTHSWTSYTSLLHRSVLQHALSVVTRHTHIVTHSHSNTLMLTFMYIWKRCFSRTHTNALSQIQINSRTHTHKHLHTRTNALVHTHARRCTHTDAFAMLVDRFLSKLGTCSSRWETPCSAPPSAKP